MFTNRKLALLLISIAGFCWFAINGCADRKIIVNSEPEGAKVSLDNELKGITPCSIPFTYYGKREVRLQKEGYQSFKTDVSINPPFIHVFPFDLLLIFLPYPLTDYHTFSYKLTKYEEIDVAKVLERGRELKKYLQQKQP